MRWLKVLVAGMTLAVSVAPFAAPAGASAPCGRLLADGEWFEIDGPRFQLGGQTLSAFAVDPRRPSILWTTNGRELHVSRDGGCGWEVAFSLADLPSLDMPISALNSKIETISVPEAPGRGDTIFLGIEETIVPATNVQGTQVGASRPHVLISRDGGRNWSLSDDGLPLVGGITALQVAPSDADIAYLLSGGTIFATDNGDRSWTERGDAPAADIEIDPLVPTELWLTGAALFHSTDGGRTNSPINYVSSPAHPADVFHAPGEPSRVLVYEPDGGAMSISEDGGRVWTRFGSPGLPMLGLAHGSSADDIIASTDKGMWRFQSPSYWIEITPGMVGGNRPEDYENVQDITVDRSPEPSAWGFRPSGSILRYERFRISLPPLEPSAPEDKGDVTFTPGAKKIRIRPGDSKTVRYDLGLPPQPTPLDVFFLVDTTVSMDSVISGLLTGIHEMSRSLTEAKIDVQFGVGEYKDYPIPGYGDPVQGDFPYRLNRAIGPADDSLVAAIEQMEASGGGRGHFPESQLTGLYQAATGEGEPGFVAPGQDAGFRPNALKVMVHLTDAAFDESAAHPSPAFDRVAQALRSRGILQVGFMSYGESPSEPAREDLRRMAEATETFAPINLEGCFSAAQQVTVGMPLQCDVMEDERGVAILAPAVVSVLRGLTEQATVELVPTEGSGIIKSIEPAAREGVNVKEPANLSFDVTYECPALAQASTTEVELVASVDDAGVASAAATVVCSPLAKVKDLIVVPPPPPPVQQPAPAIVPPPPPPAPPAPVTNAQPQPNPNPQGAMAHQEQNQPELALADQDDLEEEELLAFSVYERKQPSFLPLYTAAAALTMASAVVAARIRRASQAALARRR
ncbi:MAG: hypothetical protein ACLGHL_04925 [Actinomycetota bacterium]